MLAVAARIALRLARDWGLPAVAVERVSRSKVVDQRISLNAQAGARMIARRLPGQARIGWPVIVDRGLDPADPRIRAGLEPVLTELRAETG